MIPLPIIGPAGVRAVIVRIGLVPALHDLREGGRGFIDADRDWSPRRVGIDGSAAPIDARESRMLQIHFAGGTRGRVLHRLFPAPIFY